MARPSTPPSPCARRSMPPQSMVRGIHVRADVPASLMVPLTTPAAACPPVLLPTPACSYMPIQLRGTKDKGAPRDLLHTRERKEYVLQVRFLRISLDHEDLNAKEVLTLL